MEACILIIICVYLWSSWTDLIINRYTFRQQEKSIFAILLEWPTNGSVILNEPVVTQGHTQVRRDYFRTETTKISLRSSSNCASITKFVHQCSRSTFPVPVVPVWISPQHSTILTWTIKVSQISSKESYLFLNWSHKKPIGYTIICVRCDIKCHILHIFRIVNILDLPHNNYILHADLAAAECWVTHCMPMIQLILLSLSIWLISYLQLRYSISKIKSVVFSDQQSKSLLWNKTGGKSSKSSPWRSWNQRITDKHFCQFIFWSNFVVRQEPPSH